MLHNIFNLLLLVLTGAAWPNDCLQVKKTNELVGSCYNYGTGLDLSIRAYTTAHNEKILLGSSDQSGRFKLTVPTSIKKIFFESDGFQTITVPINFIDNSESDCNFQLSIPMFANDSIKKPQLTSLYWCFSLPSDADLKFVLSRLNTSAKTTEFNTKIVKSIPGFYLRSINPGKYILKGYNSAGTEVYNEAFNIAPGLNFKKINVKHKPDNLITKREDGQHQADVNSLTQKPNGVKGDNVRIDKLPNPTIVYFDQSSYELRTSSKSLLDSVSSYLINHPNLIARISGYTDNIGEQRLNQTLSEFRARTVAHYLTQKGIQLDKIIAEGKGPEAKNTDTGLEEDKKKSRRVNIEFISK